MKTLLCARPTNRTTGRAAGRGVGMLFMPNLNVGDETMRMIAVPGASQLAVMLSGLHATPLAVAGRGVESARRTNETARRPLRLATGHRRPVFSRRIDLLRRRHAVRDRFATTRCRDTSRAARFARLGRPGQVPPVCRSLAKGLLKSECPGACSIAAASPAGFA